MDVASGFQVMACFLKNGGIAKPSTASKKPWGLPYERAALRVYSGAKVALWLMSVSQIKVLDFRVLFRSEICDVKKRHHGHEK